MSRAVIRKGARFRHKRLYAGPDTTEKQLCVVTAVRFGVVYYRGVDADGTPWSKTSNYFPITVADQFAEWIVE